MLSARPCFRSPAHPEIFPDRMSEEEQDRMLLTVITVCRNAEKHIARTIASVLEQDAHSYEYLIIDGASTDRTCEIGESFRPAFERKGIPYAVVSEKDTGIYNAMNKAARLASGEWLIYMNADDRFHSASTLSKFQGPLTDGRAQFVYGGTVCLRGDYFRCAPPCPIEIIHRRMPFCHQSIFIRASLMRQRPYDERYRICADYDFFLWAYAQGHPFQLAEEYVSLYQMGGVSTTRRLEAQCERIRIKFANGMMSRKRFLKLMLRTTLQRIERLFLSKAERQRREELFFSGQEGWAKNESGQY